MGKYKNVRIRIVGKMVLQMSLLSTLKALKGKEKEPKKLGDFSTYI